MMQVICYKIQDRFIVYSLLLGLNQKSLGQICAQRLTHIFDLLQQVSSIVYDYVLVELDPQLFYSCRALPCACLTKSCANRQGNDAGPPRLKTFVNNVDTIFECLSFSSVENLLCLLLCCIGWCCQCQRDPGLFSLARFPVSIQEHSKLLLVDYFHLFILSEVAWLKLPLVFWPVLRLHERSNYHSQWSCIRLPLVFRHSKKYESRLVSTFQGANPCLWPEIIFSTYHVSV